MHADYKKFAYRRSSVANIQRYMLDCVLESDKKAAEEVICEEVPRAESVVPQEEHMFVFELLQKLENDFRHQMNQFKMVRTRGESALSEEVSGEKVKASVRRGRKAAKGR